MSPMVFTLNSHRAVQAGTLDHIRHSLVSVATCLFPHDEAKLPDPLGFYCIAFEQIDKT